LPKHKVNVHIPEIPEAPVIIGITKNIIIRKIIVILLYIVAIDVPEMNISSSIKCPNHGTMLGGVVAVLPDIIKGDKHGQF